MYEHQYLHVSAKHVTMQVLGLENLAKKNSLLRTEARPATTAVRRLEGKAVQSPLTPKLQSPCSPFKNRGLQ